MRRDRHDRAGAVGHEDVVGDEDGDFRAVDRVDSPDPLEHDARLVLDQLGALEVGLLRRLLLVGAHRVHVGNLVRPVVDVGVLGRNDHVGRAEQGVGAGGKDGQLVPRGGVEIHLRAGRAADPVTLGNLDAVDVVDRVEVVEQPLGVLGDAEHPLALDLVDHLAPAALADAVHDLFVRQYHLAAGAPVDRHLLFVGEPALKELEEDPLGPPVVIGIGGVDLPVPVEAESQALELGLKPLAVVVGHLFGVDVVFDGVVFGRQAEGVPAHRVEDVVALQAALARDDVQRGVGARMADVQPLPRRVGELDQRVILRLGVVVGRREDAPRLPALLPFFLNCCKIVLQCCTLPVCRVPRGK